MCWLGGGIVLVTTCWWFGDDWLCWKRSAPPVEERLAGWKRVEGFDVDWGELLELELLADMNCRSFWLLPLEPTVPLPTPPEEDAFSWPPLPEDVEMVVSRFFRSFQHERDSKICERRRESTSSPLNMAGSVVVVVVDSLLLFLLVARELWLL